MKITIEMDESGNVNIETDEEQIDVAAACLLFDLAKFKLMSHLIDTLKGSTEVDAVIEEE